jgi:hypothetical protein
MSASESQTAVAASRRNLSIRTMPQNRGAFRRKTLLPMCKCTQLKTAKQEKTSKSFLTPFFPLFVAPLKKNTYLRTENTTQCRRYE